MSYLKEMLGLEDKKQLPYPPEQKDTIRISNETDMKEIRNTNEILKTPPNKRKGRISQALIREAIRQALKEGGDLSIYEISQLKGISYNGIKANMEYLAAIGAVMSRKVKVNSKEIELWHLLHSG